MGSPSSSPRAWEPPLSPSVPYRPHHRATVRPQPLASQSASTLCDREVTVHRPPRTKGTPAQRVRTASDLEKFQCRIGCLATYYAAMLMTGQLDAEWYPKKGAPTFSGHPDKKRNVFEGDPKKFIIKLKDKLGPHLNPITRRLLDEIHSKGMKGLFRISSQMVADIDKLIHRTTTSKDPAHANTKVLQLILKVITPIFKRYERAYTPSRPLTPSKTKVELSAQELKILEEQALAEVVDSTREYNPQKYLKEAIEKVVTTHRILNLSDPQVKALVYTLLCRVLAGSFTDSQIPNTWEELKVFTDHLYGKDSQELIYTLQKMLLHKSIPSEAVKEKVWQTQIDLAITHAASIPNERTRLRKAYQQKLEEKTCRLEDYRNSLRDDLILNHREAKKLLRKKGYKNFADAKKKIILQVVKDYGYSSIDELKAFFIRAAKKQPDPKEYFLGQKRDFRLKVEIEISKLQEELYRQTQGCLYNNMTKAIRGKFLGISIQFTLSPKEKAKKICTYFDAKQSLPLHYVGLFLGLLAFVFFFIFGRLYNHLVNKATQHIMANHLPMIVQQIFASVETMLLQNEGLKGAIFSCLNSFAKSFGEPQTAAIASSTSAQGMIATPQIQVTKEELDQAKQLLKLILGLIQKINGIDQITIRGFNLSEFLTEKTVGWLAHKIALCTRSVVSNPELMNQMKETIISSLPGIFDYWDAPIIADDYVRQKARKEEETFYRETKFKIITGIAQSQATGILGERATAALSQTASVLSTAGTCAASAVSRVMEMTGTTSVYRTARHYVAPYLPQNPLHTLDRTIQSFVGSIISAATNPYGERAILHELVSLYTTHLDKTKRGYQQTLPQRLHKLRSYEQRAKDFLPPK